MITDTNIIPVSDLTVECNTSAGTTIPASTHKSRFEITTAGKLRRRTWSWNQKQAIVAESQSSHLSPAVIARKHGIDTGQLYTWRRQVLRRRFASTVCRAHVETGSVPPPFSSPAVGSRGVIEIMLLGGASVRVDADIEEPALRRLFAALRG
jgi:transposase